MKRVAYLISLIVLQLVWTACGGGGSSSTTLTSSPNGNYSAVTTTTTGQQVMSFSFTMMQGGAMSGGSMMMNMSNLQFPVASNCFGSGTVISGQMSGMGMMGVAQTLSMDMWSGPGQTGNHLHMDMTMNAGFAGANGSYVLTGVTSGCTSSSGTVTITHMM